MKSVLEIAKDARRASLELANVSASAKNKALKFIADFLLEDAKKIMAANAKDLESAAASGLSKPMLERLAINDKKIAAMVEGVNQVAALPDPVGEVIEETVRPNGLEIKKVRVPIGVIGIIYESRPNVTIDCAILCLKSGNAAILRGGSEAFQTNMALAEVISRALKAAGLNENCVQILPSSDRSLLNEMLSLDAYINCIIQIGRAHV